MLRSTLFRAADTVRRQDPQLVRIYYYQQMTERGATHLKACCVVAGHLAERAWAVMHRGTPYVICDNNGNPVSAEQAKKIIAAKWTVAEDVRKRRRSRKKAGEGPSDGHNRAGQTRRPLPAHDRRGPAPRQSAPPPDQRRHHQPTGPPTGQHACPGISIHPTA